METEAIIESCLIESCHVLKGQGLWVQTLLVAFSLVGSWLFTSAPYFVTFTGIVQSCSGMEVVLYWCFCRHGAYSPVAEGHELKLKQGSWSITKKKYAYCIFPDLYLVCYFSGLRCKLVPVMYTLYAISISLGTRKWNHYWILNQLSYVLNIWWILQAVSKLHQSFCLLSCH